MVAANWDVWWRNYFVCYCSWWLLSVHTGMCVMSLITWVILCSFLKQAALWPARTAQRCLYEQPRHFPSLNVKSVSQFLPHSGDRILITGAADSKVHVHDLTVKETIHMFGDHTNRVKRIATAPMWPNTFWSAAEDGLIRYRSPVVLPQK